MKYGFAMYILGKYSMGLMVFGAAVWIRLLWPLGILNLDILACLGHMAALGVLDGL